MSSLSYYFALLFLHYKFLHKLPNRLHLFKLDTKDKDMSYIDRCIESTVTKDIHAFYIAKHILECLFNGPMHPKNYPINFGEAWMRCYISPMLFY
jgi:hypothetical protein